MKNCVYKIFSDDGRKATGFFCNIWYQHKSLIPTLITCNHVLDEQYLHEKKEIVISL